MTSRRLFLGAAGGLAGASLAPGGTVQAAAAAGSVPFYGPHQAGITTLMQYALYFAAFDVEADSRAALIALLQN